MTSRSSSAVYSGQCREDDVIPENLSKTIKNDQKEG